VSDEGVEVGGVKGAIGAVAVVAVIACLFAGGYFAGKSDANASHIDGYYKGYLACDIHYLYTGEMPGIAWIKAVYESGTLPTTEADVREIKEIVACGQKGGQTSEER